MTVEQRDKYAYELMVKNNPEEAVKQLLLKDKIIEEKQQRINQTIDYIKSNTIIFPNGDIENDYDYRDLLKRLNGE